MCLVKITNLKKYYQQGAVTTKAIDGINLNVQTNEFLAIVGTSGSGKSTLLNIIGGLDCPSSGEVEIDKVRITDMNENQLAVFRRRNIGFIFQNYNLIENLNVYENIVLPIELDGNKIDYDYIKTLISELGLNDKQDAIPNMLSGGQQQRVAIARALASKPLLILADEPTGNLDSKTSQDVIGLIKKVSKQFKQTIIMITHDENISQLADRTIKIEDGHLVRGSNDEK